MEYLLLAYGDQAKMAQLTPAQFEQLVAQCRVHDEELRNSGHHVSSESLEWGSTCLRPRGGKTVTTDGPYLETKEQIGGVIVIEARDLNEALRIAALHPAATLGEDLGWGVEVRPFAAGCHQ
ncbi:MAG: hypothetical protein KDC87_00995 [Planctomycetes bacterium]|nr:hypothetical protein [Planctomycetota bacterium]MCB9871711.1 hypothetical protein [Planctomycetota bacterium]